MQRRRRCMILLCGTWYGCAGVWVYVLWWDGRCDGFKIRCKTFSTGRSSRKSFSTGSPSRKTQWKKVESKKPFFDCVRKPELGFSRKRPFSTDKSDCVKNGLRADCVSLFFPFSVLSFHDQTLLRCVFKILRRQGQGPLKGRFIKCLFCDVSSVPQGTSSHLRSFS